MNDASIVDQKTGQISIYNSVDINISISSSLDFAPGFPHGSKIDHHLC